MFVFVSVVVRVCKQLPTGAALAFPRDGIALWALQKFIEENDGALGEGEPQATHTSCVENQWVWGSNTHAACANPTRCCSAPRTHTPPAHTAVRRPLCDEAPPLRRVFGTDPVTVA